MVNPGPPRRFGHWASVCSRGLVCLVWLLLLSACSSKKQELIAVIPQTDGMMLWDTVHAGAEKAASRTGSTIYWNAPMREDDVAAQVKLVDRVVSSGRYQGLVIAPTQALSLISPVRRALASNIPTVVIDSPLSLRPGGKLAYILNDEEEGGRVAAQRIGALLQGKGTVALLGINPDVLGVMTRARVFEQTLLADYPGIHVVEKLSGSYNVLRERQTAEELLESNPRIDVCVTLLWTTLDGLFSALDSAHPRRSMKIVAFDVAAEPPFAQRADLDCVIQADTKEMGLRAVELIHAIRQGQPVPSVIRVRPRIITRENVRSPEILQMLSFDWSLGRWTWSATP
jgi:ribose transport system substrate-binding protein